MDFMKRECLFCKHLYQVIDGHQCQLTAEGNRAGFNPNVRSYSTAGPGYKTVQIDTLTEEELREQAPMFGPGKYERYDRGMLLALFHNRCPGGFFLVQRAQELDPTLVLCPTPQTPGQPL